MLDLRPFSLRNGQHDKTVFMKRLQMILACFQLQQKTYFITEDFLMDCMHEDISIRFGRQMHRGHMQMIALQVF